MKEFFLPHDGGNYSHIVLEKEGKSPALYFRFDSLSTTHATIAQIFAIEELGVSNHEVDQTNYLKNPLNGFRVVGAGEFTLNHRTFYHIPRSNSYNRFCLNYLQSIFVPRGLKVLQLDSY